MSSNTGNKRIKRHKRVRARVFGSGSKPRLSVYRSNKRLFAQIIDDEKRKTILDKLLDTLLIEEEWPQVEKSLVFEKAAADLEVLPM